MANVVRRLRRELGGAEYFAAVEFTTGKARSSGGRRRLHAHCLLKLPGELELELPRLEEKVRETWRTSTGAWRVQLAELRSPGAALGYLGLHHRKSSQAPPATWRGMSERASRGYWSSPIPELRARARRELVVEAIANAQGISRREAELELELRGPTREGVYRRGHGSELLEPRGELR